jgi:hypothetical protein
MCHNYACQWCRWGLQPSSMTEMSRVRRTCSRTQPRKVSSRFMEATRRRIGDLTTGFRSNVSLLYLYDRSDGCTCSCHAGDALALNNLGAMLLNGLGGFEQDHAMAFQVEYVCTYARCRPCIYSVYPVYICRLHIPPES